ncbi:MAG: hypothetical protein MK042_13560 [Cognatishimia sp.]|nr:hypothetical protein [Cognatishimia sp.]
MRLLINIRKSRNTCYLIIEHPGETAVFQLPKILSKVTKLGLYRNGRDLGMYFDQS